MGSDTTSAVCGSNWASTLTPLLPTQLLWGAQNNKSSFIPLSSASWLPLQWLGYAHTMLHRWIALGYTTLLHWLGMDASAAVVTQTSAAAELRQVLSWKSCQQLIDSVSKHLVRLVHDPTTAWHEMKLLACFVWNAAPGTLLSIYETLSAIPGMLLPSLLRHPSQWPAAVQRSTAWKLVSSWQARLGRVLSQQPHRAGQVQLIAYKPGAGQLSAWWTRNHRYM